MIKLRVAEIPWLEAGGCAGCGLEAALLSALLSALLCTPLAISQRHKTESSFLPVDILWWSVLRTVSGVRLEAGDGGHVPVMVAVCCFRREGCVSSASCRSKM